MASKLVLKGKKVVLRNLSIKDASRFCQWLKDPEVTKFLSIHNQPPPTLKEEKEWIKESQKNKTDLCLAVDTAEGKHIGIASLRGINNINKKANFGIIIGDKKYWGQGYGTEACKLIVDYGFKKLKLHRIYLTCIAYNIRAKKSYEKIGFKLEGQLRDHIFRDGHWHDEIQMGILCDEYLGKIKNEKQKIKYTYQK